MGKARPLIDLMIKRRYRKLAVTLQTPGHRVRKGRQRDCTSLKHQRGPKIPVLRAKGAPKMEGARRDWQRMSHRNSLVITNVEKPWESDSKWSISHPPISPEANLLTIFNEVFSSQLKEMLNFINTT
jgi:hypothetical protein